MFRKSGLVDLAVKSIEDLNLLTSQNKESGSIHKVYTTSKDYFAYMVLKKD